MKLSDFLNLVDVYQDIQLINAKTGEVYTDVTYLAGGAPGNLEMIDSHKADIVHGVSAGIAKNGEPYLSITIDCVFNVVRRI